MKIDKRKNDTLWFMNLSSRYIFALFSAIVSFCRWRESTANAPITIILCIRMWVRVRVPAQQPIVFAPYTKFRAARAYNFFLFFLLRLSTVGIATYSRICNKINWMKAKQKKKREEEIILNRFNTNWDWKTDGSCIIRAQIVFQETPTRTKCKCLLPMRNIDHPWSVTKQKLKQNNE